MSKHRLTVVLSQAPGKHPVKRGLEESIVAALLMEPGLEVSVVPNLYDLGPDHTGRLFLSGVRGDMVVLSWLYPRAAFWLLDRIGIAGHWGETQIQPIDAAEDDDEEAGDEAESRGIGTDKTVPDRHIYCLDLKDRNTHQPFIDEVQRIAAECRERRANQPATNGTAVAPTIVSLGLPSILPPTNGNGHAAPDTASFSPEQLLAPANRRWYPVIDYSRCTNCMECLDFCLFGVYNIDAAGRLLVENQDNCKKGCPACSRVCPEQAIMFPEYKTPAIAGAPVGNVTGLKIDLSKLFGGGDPLETAVAERDRELVADGRQAVGMAVGIPKRRSGGEQGPKDDLDKLMDDLEALDL